MKKYRARFETKFGRLWLTNNRKISCKIKDATIGPIGYIFATILDMISHEPVTVSNGVWKIECKAWHDIEIGEIE